MGKLKLSRKILLLAGMESVYGAGADPALTGANAILMTSPTLTPLNAEQAERQIVRAQFSNPGSVLAAAYGGLDFGYELAGAGSAGAIPKWDPIMRMCGFAQIQTIGQDVVYNPITDNIESGALKANLDGVEYQLKGARGNLTLNFPARDIPNASAQITSLYTVPIDNPAEVPDYSGFKVPQAANTTNTPVLMLDGVPMISSGVTINVNNTVVYQGYIGYDEVLITDRRTSIQVTAALGNMAEKNLYELARAGNPVVFSLVHGTVAGNRIGVDAPSVLVGAPQHTDDNGTAMLQFDLTAMPVEGNDELLLKVF